jgi:hypothetical protein
MKRRYGEFKLEFSGEQKAAGDGEVGIATEHDMGKRFRSVRTFNCLLFVIFPFPVLFLQLPFSSGLVANFGQICFYL